MTNTPDKMKWAVKRLTKAAKEPAAWSNYHSEVRTDDLRLLLSERAELLATVERMRGGLESIAAYYPPGHRVEELARAALTTGEANHKDKP